MAKLSRRDQKVQLAQLLFYEEDALDGTGLAEVYQETASDEGDPQTIARRESDLTNARASLRISLELREHACVSLSLTDICKRVMALKGKAGAEEALRCADKALEIASDGFWDNDEVAIEVSSTQQKLLMTAPSPSHTAIFPDTCLAQVGRRYASSQPQVRKERNNTWISARN
jgi:hypothetical protein